MPGIVAALGHGVTGPRPDRRGLFAPALVPRSVLTGTCWLSVLLTGDTQVPGAPSLDKVVECGNGW